VRLFPLPNLVLFPRDAAVAHLRAAVRELLEDALAGDQLMPWRRRPPGGKELQGYAELYPMVPGHATHYRLARHYNVLCWSAAVKLVGSWPPRGIPRGESRIMPDVLGLLPARRRACSKSLASLLQVLPNCPQPGSNWINCWPGRAVGLLPTGRLFARHRHSVQQFAAGRGERLPAVQFCYATCGKRGGVDRQ